MGCCVPRIKNQPLNAMTRGRCITGNYILNKLALKIVMKTVIFPAMTKLRLSAMRAFLPCHVWKT